DDMRARYYASKLLAATDADTECWVDQASVWGDGVPDRLIDCLGRDVPAAGDRAGAALVRFAADGRADVVAGRLAERFARLSPPGQQAALDCVAALAAANQPEVIAACRQIVRPALHHADAGVRRRAAALAL